MSSHHDESTSECFLDLPQSENRLAEDQTGFRKSVHKRREPDGLQWLDPGSASDALWQICSGSRYLRS